MKKDTFIIIFYFFYFTWLFSLTYLSPRIEILNYFTIAVIIFYFIFLRESFDILIFWLGAFIPLVMGLIGWGGSTAFVLDTAKIFYTPLWLPLAWGTTFIALRKFYLIITR